MAEIIDISTIGDNTSLNLDDGNLLSSNFGPGIELLMNDRMSSEKKGRPDEINIDDLTSLEAELNDAVSNEPSVLGLGGMDDALKIGGDIFSKSPANDSFNVKFDTRDEPKIGVDTLNSGNDNKTWDGYGKFNEIPVDPTNNAQPSPRANMSKEEALKEKFGYLKKLEGLERKGVELTKKYTMESSLQEMMGEYEMIVSEKERVNSVKFQGNMLSAAINGLEFLNNRFDPFDVKLDGWGEQFGENINDYDDIFGELHEKYKSKAKMAPELKLLFQLGGSAMMVHMTNTMFKSSLPNMDDVMRENPELMQQFNQAAVNSLGKNSPGLSGFMNNVMGSSDPSPINTGPPPAAMSTQGPQSMVPPNRPGFVEKRTFASNRPDMDVARGVNMDNRFEEIHKQERSSIVRPEMKRPTTGGPGVSDVEDILSSLKTKTVDMNESGDNDDRGSTVSISELKELSVMDGKTPKRTKRRKGSEKNVVSLEL